MREGDFVFLWAFCRMRKKKNRCTCWLAAGALINFFCSEKVVGALIGVGVLKGMNKVFAYKVFLFDLHKLEVLQVHVNIGCCDIVLSKTDVSMYV